MVPDEDPRLEPGVPPRLVDEASRGDPEALAQLLVRELPGLRAYLRLHAGPVVRARESCSDLAQSVCREVLEELKDFEWRGEAAFRHWLYRCALRKVIDRARYWQAEKRVAAREALGPDETSIGSLVASYASVCTPSRIAMLREHLEHVERAFDRLPEHYRQVILDSRLAGLSHAEIARNLGCTRAQVSTLLYRALARLSCLLDLSGAEGS